MKSVFSYIAIRIIWSSEGEIVILQCLHVEDGKNNNLMKNFQLFLAALAIAIAAVLSPSTAFAAPKSTSNPKESKSLVAQIPTNIIVEQKATLNDGRTVTVYYKKTGNNCEIYSADNLKGYVAEDLLSLDSTSFRVVTSVKGKLVYSCSVSKARSLIKQMVNTYL